MFENRLIFDEVIRRTKLCQVFWATLHMIEPAQTGVYWCNSTNMLFVAYHVKRARTFKQRYI